MRLEIKRDTMSSWKKQRTLDIPGGRPCDTPWMEGVSKQRGPAGVLAEWTPATCSHLQSRFHVRFNFHRPPTNPPTPCPSMFCWTTWNMENNMWLAFWTNADREIGEIIWRFWDRYALCVEIVWQWVARFIWRPRNSINQRVSRTNKVFAIIGYDW